MPGPLYHTGASAMCPHGGQVTTPASSPRVMVSGMPVCTISDKGIVAGCAFTVPPGKPQPCVTVTWLVGATRVMINGVPALVQSSMGICQSAEQIPGGPPSIVSTQTRVIAQ